jgi:3'-phosphoadenosine 5'-phosphosulfate sulfotransferase (PAPS reductase)/FAD synthetase
MLIRLIAPRNADFPNSQTVRAWLNGQRFHEAGTRNTYTVHDAERLSRNGVTGVFFPAANVAVDINPENIRGF